MDFGPIKSIPAKSVTKSQFKLQNVGIMDEDANSDDERDLQLGGVDMDKGDEIRHNNEKEASRNEFLEVQMPMGALETSMVSVPDEC